LALKKTNCDFLISLKNRIHIKAENNFALITPQQILATPKTNGVMPILRVITKSEIAAV
jgi:hypothetical protein